MVSIKESSGPAESQRMFPLQCLFFKSRHKEMDLYVFLDNLKTEMDVQDERAFARFEFNTLGWDEMAAILHSLLKSSLKRDSIHIYILHSDTLSFGQISSSYSNSPKLSMLILLAKLTPWLADAAVSLPEKICLCYLIHTVCTPTHMNNDALIN